MKIAGGTDQWGQGFQQFEDLMQVGGLFEGLAQLSLEVCIGLDMPLEPAWSRSSTVEQPLTGWSSPEENTFPSGFIRSWRFVKHQEEVSFFMNGALPTVGGGAQSCSKGFRKAPCGRNQRAPVYTQLWNELNCF